MKTEKKLQRRPGPIVYPVTNPFGVHVFVNCKEAETQQKTLIICGLGYTEDNGELTIRLTDTPNKKFLNVAHCAVINDEGEVFDVAQAVVIGHGVVSFMATAQATANATKPSILTWRTESIDEFKEASTQWFEYYNLENYSRLRKVRCHYDVSITVKSWNPDSTPADRVFFSWLCVAEGAVVLAEDWAQ